MGNSNLNPPEIAASEAILRILDRAGEPMHSTKLVKLAYLVDYLHFRHYGRTMTGFQYMWDHFGPNAVGHAVVGKAEELVREKRATTNCYPNIHGGQTVDFGIAEGATVHPLPGHAEMIIDDVIGKFNQMSTEEISEASKQTEPFKNAEQYGLLVMTHSAPTMRGDDDEWAKHKRELEEEGLYSLEEVKEKFGVA